MAERPGIMFYFDLLPSLQMLTAEETGKLFLAAMEYGASGTEPDFSGAIGAIWLIIKQKVDADGAKYAKKCVGNAYNTYCREAKERKVDPLPKAEWLELYSGGKSSNDIISHQTISIDIERYPTTTPTPTTTTTPTTTPKNTNKREGHISAAKPPRSFRFIPPTVEQVREYCEQRHNDVDPQQFVDFYESKGWMVGKNKMKSWQSSVRTWEGRRKKDPVPERRGASFADLLKEMEDEERGETA